MTRLAIISGPSKWDFALSVFDGGVGDRRGIEFFFEGNSGGTYFLNGVKREYGNDEDWFFEGAGYLWKDVFLLHTVRGLFSTKTRKGWMEFKKPSTT